MEKEQKKKNRFITGVYPCMWCWLLSPDTRYNDNGVYGCEMIMSVADAKALINADVQAITAAEGKEVRDKNPQAREWKTVWPLKDYDGDDESLRGMKVIKFAQKVVPNCNFTVDVFDANNVQIEPSSMRIGNMTKLRLNFYVRVVLDTMNKCVRVLFHPRGAQIIELIPWRADYGFEATEGFTAGGSAKKDISDFRPEGNNPSDPFADDNPDNQGPGIPEDDIPFIPNKA